MVNKAFCRVHWASAALNFMKALSVHINRAVEKINRCKKLSQQTYVRHIVKEFSDFRDNFDIVLSILGENAVRIMVLPVMNRYICLCVYVGSVTRQFVLSVPDSLTKDENAVGNIASQIGNKLKSIFPDCIIL